MDLLLARVAGAEYGARKERRAYLWAERKAAQSEVCVSKCFELRRDTSGFGLRGKDRPRRLLKLLLAGGLLRHRTLASTALSWRCSTTRRGTAGTQIFIGYSQHASQLLLFGSESVRVPRRSCERSR